jgi:hypothetical protein
LGTLAASLQDLPNSTRVTAIFLSTIHMEVGLLARRRLLFASLQD